LIKKLNFASEIVGINFVLVQKSGRLAPKSISAQSVSPQSKVD